MRSSLLLACGLFATMGTLARAVVITSPPLAQTVTVGDTVTYPVVATGTGLLTYQWRKDGVNLTGNASANTATLTLPAVTMTDAGNYDVIVTDSTGSTPSPAAVLTILKATAAIALGGTTYTYDGLPHGVTVTTVPAGLTVNVTYAGSATAPTNAGGYAVSAVVTDPNYQGSVNAVLVIVPAPQTINFPQPPDRLPTDGPFDLLATSSSGLTVTFTLASGSTGVATLAGNTVTLTGGTGRVTVRAQQAGGGNFAEAPPVERVFYVATEYVPPRITASPAGHTGSIGDRVTLTAAAVGLPDPTFQWQLNGVAIPGATNPVLTLASATLADSGLYVLVAMNSVGTASTVPVAVNIDKKAQAIALATAPAALPAGSSIRLGGIASSGLPVTLALVSGAGSLSGDLLTGNSGSVLIRATQAGDATYAPVTLERTYTFIAGGVSPFLTVSPADQTALAGATVTFRATAIGSPAPTYQWFKDGTALPGGTGATLTLAGVTLAEAGRYRIEASNPVGTATAAAALTVRSAPAIVVPPADQSVAAGSPATFSVTVTGFPAPAYQWRRDGVALAGATDATLTVPSPRNSHEGRYDVVVSNELGSVTSPPATLAVDMRDVSGTYFGQFAGTTGNFALLAREDGTGAFVGHLPGIQTGIVTLDLTVDFAGNFRATTTTVAARPAGQIASPLSGFATPPTAGAPQTVTLRGTLDEGTGALTGTVAELGLSLTGTRAARTGAAATQAGFYRAVLAGSADGHGYVIVAPDGQALVFTASGTALESASGRIGDTGRLRLTTASQAAIDLGFANGLLAGTVRLPNGTTVPIAGSALELAGAERLINLSVRSATTAASPLITGFVIGGTGAKRVLIRAAGPAIAASPFNVANAVNNPSIQLLRDSATLAQNENWGTPAANAAAITAATAQAGAFPFRNNSNDAALLQTLEPGAYTVRVGGGAGVVLSEIYEVLEETEVPGTRRLMNVSARGPVTAASPLIAGFVIVGATPQRVLIRAIGPTIERAPFNVAGALDNPVLTLYRGRTIVKSSQAWFRDPDAALIRNAAAAVGAFALGAQSPDAAMLIYLAPGAYTAQVTGAAGSNPTGIALIEAYEVAP